MQSLWMVAASLLFACMGVCVKLAAEQFSAAELVFWRGFVATVLLGGYILARRLPLATPHARTHIVRGVSGFVSLVMYFYAIAMIPLAAAVTLNYTSPLFLALLLVLWAYYDAIRYPTLLLRGADSDLLLHETAVEMTQRGPKP